MADVSETTRSNLKQKNKKSKAKSKSDRELKNATTINGAYIEKCSNSNINIRPVLSKDLRNVICACGPHVAVFRRKTGILENFFNQHKTDVHSLFLHPKDPLQIVSCCSRFLIFWDYKDVTISKKYYVGNLKPTACQLSSLNPINGYFKIPHFNAENKISKKEELVYYNLKSGKNDELLKIGFLSRKQKAFAVDSTDKYIGFVYKEKLTIYSLEQKHSHIFKSDDTQLTCLAFHPNKRIVATGDKLGKIVIWHKYHKKDAISMHVHWHNDMVCDLLFTHTPVPYLMSGGKEGVLVIWQIETQHKTFVPRLGGAIDHLFQSDDSQYIGATLDSNVLKILASVNNTLTSSIRLLSQAYEHTVGLKYHPQTACLVLNGRVDGELQFYHPYHKSVKMKIDVVGENLVSSVPERYVYPTRLEAVDFSVDGIWMATVEVRQDRILPVERKLKIWKYSTENQNYVLNTYVEPPHDDAVTVLKFRPACKTSHYSYILITASKDGFIKTWVLAEEKNEKDELSEIWQHHSLSNYGIRDRCIRGAFSEDGSILALLFTEVTLWDPETLTYQTSLSWNQGEGPLRSMTFCCEESSNYLISYSDNCIFVWDIKTCSIKWKLLASTTLVVTDPFSKYFAAFVRFDQHSKNHIYLFDPACPNPIDMVQNRIKPSAPVIDAIFTPPAQDKGKTKWSQIGSLFYLTEGTQIMSVREPAEHAQEGLSQMDRELDEMSTFESIFGAVSKDETGIPSREVLNQHVPAGNPSSVVIRKMMSTPGHVLPSVDIMCQTFIKSLLIQKKSDEESLQKLKSRDNGTSEKEDGDMEAEDHTEHNDVEKKGLVIENESNLTESTDMEISPPIFQLPKYDFEFLNLEF